MIKKTLREKKTYLLIKANKKIERKKFYYLLSDKIKEYFGKLIYSEMNFKTLKIWERRYKGKKKTYEKTKIHMEKNNLYVISAKRDFERMLKFILPSITLNQRSNLNLKTIKVSHTIQSLREFIKKEIEKKQ
ncbi:MAG: Rpp14/Pop5 family protein [Candidatus Woesearchaeota archaeon]